MYTLRKIGVPTLQTLNKVGETIVFWIFLFVVVVVYYNYSSDALPHTRDFGQQLYVLIFWRTAKENDSAGDNIFLPITRTFALLLWWPFYNRRILRGPQNAKYYLNNYENSIEKNCFVSPNTRMPWQRYRIIAPLPCLYNLFATAVFLPRRRPPDAIII